MITTSTLTMIIIVLQLISALIAISNTFIVANVTMIVLSSTCIKVIKFEFSSNNIIRQVQCTVSCVKQSWGQSAWGCEGRFPRVLCGPSART